MTRKKIEQPNADFVGFRELSTFSQVLFSKFHDFPAFFGIFFFKFRVFPGLEKDFETMNFCRT